MSFKKKFSRISLAIVLASSLVTAVPTSTSTFAKENQLESVLETIDFQSIENIDVLKSEEAKIILNGLELYKDYYTYNENGYVFLPEASEGIPNETYNLLKDTFMYANQYVNQKIRESVKDSNSSKEIGVYAVDPGGATVPGKSADTYYYEGTNWTVGTWIYANDKDTRTIVTALILGAAVAEIIGIILGLFVAALPAASAAICGLIAGTAAAIIANYNKGKGVYFKYNNSGFAIGSR